MLLSLARLVSRTLTATTLRGTLRAPPAAHTHTLLAHCSPHSTSYFLSHFEFLPFSRFFFSLLSKRDLGQSVKTLNLTPNGSED